ncbi:MAG: hypothetical protein KBC81_02125 [Candidatus Pacebacteria bacterium]|nr:hypothetical protein [Candidatus Paceibacterota bacterium]
MTEQLILSEAEEILALDLHNDPAGNPTKKKDPVTGEELDEDEEDDELDKDDEEDTDEDEEDDDEEDDEDDDDDMQ